MSYAIKLGRGYLSAMTGIGPAFGATKRTAIRFKTKREAEQLICTFPWGAMGAESVKVEAPAPRAQRRRR